MMREVTSLAGAKCDVGTEDELVLMAMEVTDSHIGAKSLRSEPAWSEGSSAGIEMA
jgi:hypothetical protein